MINNYYQYDKYQTEFFLKLRFLRDLGKQGYFVHKNIDIINISFFWMGRGDRFIIFLFTCNIFLIAKNQWFLERGISLFLYFFFGCTYIWIPFYIFTGPSCYIIVD